jgi:hypothetical protein
MSDLIDFVQSNWYELGSLAVQFAILAIVVSFGRRILSILSIPLAASSAASQAQVELLQDLQKLSDTHGSRPPEEPQPVAYGGVGRMLSPTPGAPADNHAEWAVLSHRESRSPWRALVAWLKTPMNPGASRRRIIRQAS